MTGSQSLSQGPQEMNDMEERRATQQQQLDRIIEGMDNIQRDLSNLREDVAGRLGRLEEQIGIQARSLAETRTETAKHAANLNWIKGAGAASVAILGGLIVWILDHLVFKSS
jgi:hypothetical protein